MKYFVSGSTGFIGNKLVDALMGKGYQVNVLVRNKQAYTTTKKEIKIFQGDLLNVDVLNEAIKGCDFAFHLAAYANIWSKDKSLAYNTNVLGTKNVLEAALNNNIKKLVFTSSAATLPPSVKDEIVDETFALPDTYLTEYETTKKAAEQLCMEYFKKGLNVVIVNPSRVYGPGLLNKSNSVTILIKKYLEGKWRIIPGDGTRIGNYVYIDDVVSGHILALENGKSGEKYILGGTNNSYNEFFNLLAKSTGKKFRLFHLPLSVMLVIANFEFFMAETFGKKPLITPPWVKRYNQNRPLSNEKAIKNLQYSFTPLNEGIKKTVNWLNSK